jgi:hypothetical protein
MNVNRVASEPIRGRHLFQFFFEILQSRGIGRLHRGPIEVPRVAAGSFDADLQLPQIFAGWATRWFCTRHCSLPLEECKTPANAKLMKTLEGESISLPWTT